MQGQALRDSATEFAEADCVVLGASFDTPAENLAFAEAQGFRFRLLSDEDRSVGASYGVVRPAGDQYSGYPERVSFLIDRQGVVQRVYEVADVTSHAAIVLGDLQALQQ